MQRWGNFNNILVELSLYGLINTSIIAQIFLSRSKYIIDIKQILHE